MGQLCKPQQLQCQVYTLYVYNRQIDRRRCVHRLCKLLSGAAPCPWLGTGRCPSFSMWTGGNWGDLPAAQPESNVLPCTRPLSLKGRPRGEQGEAC